MTGEGSIRGRLSLAAAPARRRAPTARTAALAVGRCFRGSGSVPNRVARTWCAAVAMTATAALLAAGCGGDSKPAYCADRDALQESVQGLTIPTSTSELGSLQSQLTKIQDDATTLVTSAKGDFPSETSSIKSSVDTLANAVEALPANPSAAQIAPIATDVSAVVNSVKSFTDATSSKCS